MEQMHFRHCGISNTGHFKGQIRQIFAKIITDTDNLNTGRWSRQILDIPCSCSSTFL